MKKNMGSSDRFIRIFVTIVLASLYYAGIVTGTLGIVLLVIAGIMLLTSFIGYCPLYAPFGFSTCPRPDRAG